MINTETKEQARRLFFQSGLTQQQIADIVGINPRTLFDWMREGDWKRARKAALTAPILITEQYYDQLVAMNQHIRQREERPYPTKEEADIMRKLSATIRQVKTKQNIGEVTEMFMRFSVFVRSNRPKDLQNMMECMDGYVQSLMPRHEILAATKEENEIDTDYKRYLEDLHAAQRPIPGEHPLETPTADVPAPIPPEPSPAIPEPPTPVYDDTFGALLADHINSQAEADNRLKAGLTAPPAHRVKSGSIPEYFKHRQDPSNPLTTALAS